MALVDRINATMEKQFTGLSTPTYGLQDRVKSLSEIVTRRAKIWIYSEVTL